MDFKTNKTHTFSFKRLVRVIHFHYEEGLAQPRAFRLSSFRFPFGNSVPGSWELGVEVGAALAHLTGAQKAKTKTLALP